MKSEATILVRNKKALDNVLGASSIIAEGLDANIKYAENDTTAGSESQEKSATYENGIRYSMVDGDMQERLAKNAQTSDLQLFAESIFPKVFNDVAQESYAEQTEAFTSLFEERAKYKAIMAVLAEMLYKEFNK